MANVIRSLRNLTPTLEDADLVLAARSGETWAREALLRRHAGAVHGLSFRLLGPHAGARQVVETAFIEAFRALPELAEPAAIVPWILRVSVGVVRARLARPLLPRRRARSLRPDFAGLRSQLVLAGNVEQQDEVLAYYERLEGLPRDARLIVLLRELEGMSVSDAAYCLQLSQASVRRALHRAENTLRARGTNSRAPALLRASSGELPIPLSEFERAQLHRRVEAALANPTRSAWRSRAAWTAATLGISASLVLGLRAELERGRATTSSDSASAKLRVLELPDGSRASLSGAAELRVDAAEPSRVHLTLLAGRADFRLARGAAAEFVVHAGDTEVKAFGHALSVALEDAKDLARRTVEVRATDGAVDILRAGDNSAITLGSGESWIGQVTAPAPNSG